MVRQRISRWVVRGVRGEEGGSKAVAVTTTTTTEEALSGKVGQSIEHRATALQGSASGCEGARAHAHVLFTRRRSAGGVFVDDDDVSDTTRRTERCPLPGRDIPSSAHWCLGAGRGTRLTTDGSWGNRVRRRRSRRSCTAHERYATRRLPKCRPTGGGGTTVRAALAQVCLLRHAIRMRAPISSRASRARSSSGERGDGGHHHHRVKLFYIENLSCPSPTSPPRRTPRRRRHRSVRARHRGGPCSARSRGAVRGASGRRRDSAHCRATNARQPRPSLFSFFLFSSASPPAGRVYSICIRRNGTTTRNISCCRQRDKIFRFKIRFKRREEFFFF